jgi:hypothetical protein
MPSLRPVIWQDAFIRAVDEPNPETLAHLIHDAEFAICLGWQQLANPNDYRNEVRSMNLATLAMNAIKTQKLCSAGNGGAPPVQGETTKPSSFSDVSAQPSLRPCA